MVATCDAPDPSNFLKWSVKAGDPPYLEIPVEQNPRLGGSGASPCPGDLIAMALAACMDGAIRMVADRRGVELEAIRVVAINRGDVREILGVGDLPEPEDIGLAMTIEVVPGVDQSREKVETVLQLAERASAVLGLIRAATPVTVSASIVESIA
jgi:uncharacterized OsmC-like protein